MFKLLSRSTRVAGRFIFAFRLPCFIYTCNGILCMPMHVYLVLQVALIFRCQCNGHAKECLINKKQKTAECKCRHNTIGRECEKCRTMYWLYKWQPGRYSRTDEAGTATLCKYFLPVILIYMYVCM